MPALIVASAVVGGLVATRRPANPIGWIFCGFGAVHGPRDARRRIRPGRAATTRRTALGQAAAWFANWSFVAVLALSVFVLLLFPDGRLPSPRWRRRLVRRPSALLALAAGAALDPGQLTDYPA